jgi:hypothetical protein
MIRLGCPHYSNCLAKIDALTTVGGGWPRDTHLWKAGTPPALEQVVDMARVFWADLQRPERDPARIWTRDEAEALLKHLCEAVTNRAVYPCATKWCRTLLREI